MPRPSQRSREAKTFLQPANAKVWLEKLGESEKSNRSVQNGIDIKQHDCPEIWT